MGRFFYVLCEDNGSKKPISIIELSNSIFSGLSGEERTVKIHEFCFGKHPQMSLYHSNIWSEKRLEEMFPLLRRERIDSAKGLEEFKERLLFEGWNWEVPAEESFSLKRKLGEPILQRSDVLATIPSVGENSSYSSGHEGGYYCEEDSYLDYYEDEFPGLFMILLVIIVGYSIYFVQRINGIRKWGAEQRFAASGGGKEF